MFSGLQEGFLMQGEGEEGGGTMSLSAPLPPASLADCRSRLASLRNQQPSATALIQLASIPIGQLIQGTTAQDLPLLYIQVASIHLREGVTTSNVGDVVSALIAVVKSIGRAATKCERTAISSTGILPSMYYVIIHSGSLQTLTYAQVEFFQVATLAGQYRYVQRQTKLTNSNIWPRPLTATLQNPTTAEDALRYYYLRGIMHLGCDQMGLARRCFWTCLSVPQEIVSVVSICAWKKLVLLQCLLSSKTGKIEATKLMNLPPGASPGLGRFIASAIESSKTLEGAASSAGQLPHQVSALAPEIEHPGSGDGPIEAAGTILAQQSQWRGTVLASSVQMRGTPPYCLLVKAFCEETDPGIFQKVATEYSSLWLTDTNTGLVERMASWWRHKELLSLAAIYSVLPLSQIVTELNLSSAKEARLLLAEIPQLQLEYLENDFCKISIVVDPESDNRDAATPMKELIQLVDRLRTLDSNLALSSKFKHVKANSKHEGGSTKRNPVGVEDF